MHQFREVRGSSSLERIHRGINLEFPKNSAFLEDNYLLRTAGARRLQIRQFSSPPRPGFIYVTSSQSRGKMLDIQ